MILLFLAIIALITLVIILSVGGLGSLIGLVIAFGDVIVAIAAILWLLNWLINRRHRK